MCVIYSVDFLAKKMRRSYLRDAGCAHLELSAPEGEARVDVLKMQRSREAAGEHFTPREQKRNYYTVSARCLALRSELRISSSFNLLFLPVKTSGYQTQLKQREKTSTRLGDT